jgi:phage protein D
LAGISYQVLIDGKRLSPEMIATIQLEVEDHARMADMLRLQMPIAVHENGEKWTVLDEDIFPRLANIRVEVSVGKGSSIPLISAHVIESHAEFSNEPGKSLLKVVAMDPTVLMNLDEKVRPWPDMADSDIASAILSEYGFETDVETTTFSRQEIDTKTIQRATDIQFLQQLAKRNGYECYVEMSPQGVSGSSKGIAHFHKPRVDEKAQGVLSINMGSATNVNSFKARFEMLKPVIAQATGLEIETQSDQPASAESASVNNLGKSPAADNDRPRRVLISQSGMAGSSELQTYAQAMVDESSWAITAEGELNTVAYGDILRAKRPVLVRGAGRQFSGPYYVEKVLHILNGDGYVQRFSLRRNALGLTKKEDFSDEAQKRL